MPPGPPPSASPLAPGPRRGRPTKNEAITRAARIVFGRDGYSRASIDVIAAEADVSTRTIYNHFDSKEELFATVLQASATEVAESFLAKVADVRPDGRLLEELELTDHLVVLADALITQANEFPDHFALVRHISAETDHFPQSVTDRWLEAGPLRVQGEVTRQLTALADRGLLEIGDPTRATRHFIALAASEVTNRTPLSVTSLDTDERAVAITSAVQVFLHGYAH